MSAKTKKNFLDSAVLNLDNPALNFINTTENTNNIDKQTKTKQNIPDGYKLNPEYIEIKSKRVQLVLRPSIFEKAKNKANVQQISLNEYIHRLIEADT